MFKTLFPSSYETMHFIVHADFKLSPIKSYIKMLLINVFDQIKYLIIPAAYYHLNNKPIVGSDVDAPNYIIHNEFKKNFNINRYFYYILTLLLQYYYNYNII